MRFTDIGIKFTPSIGTQLCDTFSHYKNCEECAQKEIKRQMLREHKKYPLVGDYEVDEKILDEDILELSNINWDKEIKD